MVVSEDFKSINELVVNGFTNIPEIVEANLGNAEQLEAKDLKSQAEQIYVVIPELLVCFIVIHAFMKQFYFGFCFHRKKKLHQKITDEASNIIS